MASYNTVITNEGAALLASVIANQGTLTLSEMRFSTTDYDGVEATLTVGTFAGVFITAAASGSVVDATTIKVGAQFDNSGIVGDHPLYSIGIVGTDGNTTALIAVCTTTNPDIIRAALTGVSTYAFNVNLAVSSTSNITVAGTTAAVLYDTDVVDNLTSISTNKPLSANQGRLVADNLAANENVYGAKNLNSYPYYETTKNVNGITFTDNGDGTITVSSGTASAAIVFYCHYLGVGDFVLEDGNYIVDGCPSGGSAGTYCLLARYVKNDNSNFIKIDTGNGIDFSVSEGLQGENKTFVSLYISIENGTVISTPITFKPMLRDARIIDPTFAPFAETNLQLTQNKAERTDLTTIHATGSTNTTGAQINAGTFFYLNGSYCKALTNIAANATFTLNTNYEEVTVGGELTTLIANSVNVNKVADITVTPSNWSVGTCLYNILIRLDFNKLTPFSYIIVDGTDVFKLSYKDSDSVEFFRTRYTNNHIETVVYRIKSGNNLAVGLSNGTETDYTSVITSAVFRLYY